MEKKRKDLPWAAIVVVLICVAVIGGMLLEITRDNKVSEEQEAENQLLLAYFRQNVAFRLFKDDKYRPMSDREGTEDGVYSERYFDLACYRKLTGNELAYEQVKEYLSKQYEEDGEVRIYNNGRHPEIEQYVEWALEHEREKEDYNLSVFLIYRDYVFSYGNDSWMTQWRKAGPVVIYRNQAILDELIKKEADPNYVMDEQIMWAGLDFGPLAESKP